MNPYYHTRETAPTPAAAAAGGTGPSPQTRRSFLQRLTVGATAAGTGVALTSLAGTASADDRRRRESAREREIERDRRVWPDIAFDGGVGDVALVPEGHVFHRGDRIGAHHAR